MLYWTVRDGTWAAHNVELSCTEMNEEEKGVVMKGIEEWSFGLVGGGGGPWPAHGMSHQRLERRRGQSFDFE